MESGILTLELWVTGLGVYHTVLRGVHARFSVPLSRFLQILDIAFKVVVLIMRCIDHCSYSKYYL